MLTNQIGESAVTGGIHVRICNLAGTLSPTPIYEIMMSFMTSPIKLLILDYGGVYSFGHDPASEAIIFREAFGVELCASLNKSLRALSTRLSTGSVETEEYIRQVGLLFGAPRVPSVDQFVQLTLQQSLPPSREMLDLVWLARHAGIEVALLSDMYGFEVEATKDGSRYSGFDYVGLSSVVGNEARSKSLSGCSKTVFGSPCRGSLRR